MLLRPFFPSDQCERPLHVRRLRVSFALQGLRLRLVCECVPGSPRANYGSQGVRAPEESQRPSPWLLPKFSRASNRPNNGTAPHANVQRADQRLSSPLPPPSKSHFSLRAASAKALASPNARAWGLCAQWSPPSRQDRDQWSAGKPLPWR